MIIICATCRPAALVCSNVNWLRANSGCAAVNLNKSTLSLSHALCTEIAILAGSTAALYCLLD
jgi:hypothetical protein